MLLGLVALISSSAFATGTLHGTTQYGANGFKYKILSVYKTEGTGKVNEVSISQNVYSSQGNSTMVIPATVDIYVNGTDDETTPVAVDQVITFKVVEIEANAFKDVKTCSGGNAVTAVTIGSNIRKINAGAFDGCSNMTSIQFDANTNEVDIADDAFKGTAFTALDLTPLSKLTTVNKWFGSSYAPGTGDVAGTAVNSSLEEVKFPGSLKAIVQNAFGGCEALTTVSFPANTLKTAEVLVISQGAFHGTAIETLDLTEAKIVTLNKLFDSDNVTLTSVSMPKSDKFTTLAVNALADCIQLKTVDFTKATKLTTLNNGCLSNTVINTLDFNKNILLTALPATPFVNATTTTNKNLKTVILPWNSSVSGTNKCPVTEISTAFANCEKLTTITYLDLSNVTTIADAAFSKCISLAALTLPKTLTAVNGSPFAYCSALETLTFKGDCAATIGNGSALFGTDADALAALKTLVIEGNFSGTIKSAALFTNTGLTSLTISDAKTFSGTIESSSIKMSEGTNATIKFGKITGAINTISGPVGTYKTTLTTGEFAPTSSFTNAIVSGVIDVATIAKISEASGIIAIGNAEKIVVSGDVTVAQTAPTAAPKSALTAIEFNGALGNGSTPDIIAATTFDETLAPNLQTVKFQPTTAPTAAVFNKNAFHTSASALHPAEKVTLTTTTAVAALYGDVATVFDANLVNVKFVISDVVNPDPTTIFVYGRADAEYFYGKMTLDATKKYAIDKETVDGEQVTVYSAFVDSKDQKIYMDPLALNNGQYIIGNAAAMTNSVQAVIIRVKNPQTTTAVAKVDGGLSAKVVYTETAAESTMRYKSGQTTPFNDLQSSTKLFSSDFIGTNYVGKTLYAMKNPAKEGKLAWGIVSVDSYLPKESAFVETIEGASAPELSVVWLDEVGQDDYTGIIEKVTGQQANNDGAIYNLQGVRVSNVQKGLYIKNGKKFIVK